MTRRRTLLVFVLGVIGMVVMPALPADAQPAEVGTAEPGNVAFAFVGRIEQNGASATDFGYLNAVRGLDESLLLTAATRWPAPRRPPASPISPTRGCRADARLQTRSVNGNPFLTAGTAQTTLYFNEGAGAVTDPASFRRGTVVATYESSWHDIVNVQHPDVGIARVESDDTQLTTSRFVLAGSDYLFGHAQQRLRLSFTGQGTRSNAQLPRAEILYRGKATALTPPAQITSTAAAGTSGWVWAAVAAAAAALALSIVALMLAGSAAGDERTVAGLGRPARRDARSPPPR